MGPSLPIGNPLTTPNMVPNILHNRVLNLKICGIFIPLSVAFISDIPEPDDAFGDNDVIIDAININSKFILFQHNNRIKKFKYDNLNDVKIKYLIILFKNDNFI